MNEPTPFCLMPWIHFHVGNHGTVKACCVANIPYGNINQQSLETIWQDEPIQKLRAKFLRGEKDNRCAQCIQLEAAGGKSIRQETFEKFPKINVQQNPPSLPIYFDIRFSNVCNFRCRTCWHGASSKWFSDAKKLGRNFGKKAIIQNIRDFDAFLEKNGEALLQAQEIYFAGGEPLVTEEHYLLLQWLIENNVTQVRLRYNTNFSILKFRNYNVIELWENFSEVEVLASLDATEALGEFIRKEMKWDLILENRRKILPLSNVSFKIAPTISVYNIFHLPQLYLQCLELEMIQPDDLYLNILERPVHFNIKILPTSYKVKVKETFQVFFENHSIPLTIQSMFQECIDFMMAEDLSQHWEKFQVENSLLAGLRNENSKGV